MFARYKSNAKKTSIIKSFLSFMPMLSLVSSIFSLVLIFLYLKNISMLDIFMRIEFSAQVLAAIFLVFMLFFSWVLIVFYSIGYKPYKFKSKPRFRVFLCCSLVRPIIILILLIILFLCFGIDYCNFTIAFFLLVVPLIIILASLNDNEVMELICFIKDKGMCSFTYLPMFLLMVKILGEDSEIFKFVLFSLLFLGLNDLFIIITSKNKQDIYYRIFPTLLAFATIFTIVDGFKFQKAILKVFGGAQDSSQSGWYLVKDRDVLDFFTERDYLIKYNKNIDDRENYYINGYLIFNIGGVRVICPHDFEAVYNKEFDNKNLYLSRCLSLTSEDIKFMKRGFPKNNEKYCSDDSKNSDENRKDNDSKKYG